MKKAWTNYQGHVVRGEVIEEYTGSRERPDSAEFEHEKYVSFKPDGDDYPFYGDEFETTPDMIYTSKKSILKLQIDILKNNAKELNRQITKLEQELKRELL